MPETSDKTKKRAGLIFLLCLTVAALSFCYVLIAPFLRPILLSAVLAILFYPVHSRIARRIRNRNVSALLSTCLVVLLIVLSAVFLGQALATGLRDIYQSLSNSGDGSERLSLYLIHLFDRTVDLVSSYLPISSSDLRSAAVKQAENGVSAILGMTAGVLSSFTALLANSLIAFFILFFLLRDGNAMLRRAPFCFHCAEIRPEDSLRWSKTLSTPRCTGHFQWQRCRELLPALPSGS